MKDLFKLNCEIDHTQRYLNSMREVLSPSNTAVITLEKRLQELLQEKKSVTAEFVEKMKDLPPEVQEMLKLRYIKGMQWAEVAKSLHYSQSTVYKWHNQYKNSLPKVF